MDDQELQTELRRQLEDQERATRELAETLAEAARRDGGA